MLILFLPSIILAISLKIALVMHAIPSERFSAPANALRLKSPPSAKSLAKTSGQRNPSYIDLMKIKNPHSPAVDICSNFVRKAESRSPAFQVAFMDWETSEPLTEDLRRCVESNHDMVEDLLKIATAGGLPWLSCEEAAALTDYALFRTNFNDLDPFFPAKLLIVENRIRRNRGDEQGAAEALVAILKLSRSSGEPLLLNCLKRNATRGACFIEIDRWLKDTPPRPDAARILKNVLGNDDDTTLDWRRYLELEYRIERYQFIKSLTRSLGKVFTDNYGEGGSYKYVDGFIIASDLMDAPIQTVSRCVSDAAESFKYKTNARSMLEMFDAEWAVTLEDCNKAEAETNFLNERQRFANQIAQRIRDQQALKKDLVERLNQIQAAGMAR